MAARTTPTTMRRARRLSRLCVDVHAIAHGNCSTVPFLSMTSRKVTSRCRNGRSIDVTCDRYVKLSVPSEVVVALALRRGVDREERRTAEAVAGVHPEQLVCLGAVPTGLGVEIDHRGDADADDALRVELATVHGRAARSTPWLREPARRRWIQPCTTTVRTGITSTASESTTGTAIVSASRVAARRSRLAEAPGWRLVHLIGGGSVSRVYERHHHRRSTKSNSANAIHPPPPRLHSNHERVCGRGGVCDQRGAADDRRQDRVRDAVGTIALDLLSLIHLRVGRGGDSLGGSAQCDVQHDEEQEQHEDAA